MARITKTARLWSAAALGIPLVWGWGMIVFSPPPDWPKLPVDLANGIYVNERYGQIELDSGSMTVNGQVIKYEVEQIKDDRFVKPEFHVGVTYGDKILLERSYEPELLRLSDEEKPSQITLTSETLARHRFVRVESPDVLNTEGISAVSGTISVEREPTLK